MNFIRREDKVLKISAISWKTGKLEICKISSECYIRRDKMNKLSCSSVVAMQHMQHQTSGIWLRRHNKEVLHQYLDYSNHPINVPYAPSRISLLVVYGYLTFDITSDLLIIIITFDCQIKT
uniref:Uncharacterized protein n=1 Tax=Glossina pallidipes TaxID=7398 RepID=A0A1A9ZD58_GLOPL